jgi:hypothetical protein
LPRCSINAVSSRATRRPEIDVSGIAARHSRVTSSTMFKMRGTGGRRRTGRGQNRATSGHLAWHP